MKRLNMDRDLIGSQTASNHRFARNGFTMGEMLLQTTVVGSYPQLGLAGRPPIAEQGRAAHPREGHVARLRTWLEQAQDDATLLAIRDMERAGIDVITDGEMRRESYSNRFATAWKASTMRTRQRS